MGSTKRLIVLLVALLSTVGAAGSAVAGFVIEGDMNSMTAFLAVMISTIIGIIATAIYFVNLIYRGQQSRNKFTRALANQLHKDIKGLPTIDPAQDDKMQKIIELLMEIRQDSRQQNSWQNRP